MQMYEKRVCRFVIAIREHGKGCTQGGTSLEGYARINRYAQGRMIKGQSGVPKLVSEKMYDFHDYMSFQANKKYYFQRYFFSLKNQVT